MNKTICICASGNSVSEGIQKGLLDILPDYCTIGLNYWFKYGCETTINSFVDWQFYITNVLELSKCGLVIGKHDTSITHNRSKGKTTNYLKDNTVLLPYSRVYYGVDSWKTKQRVCMVCRHEWFISPDKRIPKECPKCRSSKIIRYGFYSSQLVGLFSLTLAIALGFDKIYLLGYDCCELEGKTHFYQGDVNFKEMDCNDRPKFKGLGKKILKNGKEVYNTSPYNSVDNINQMWFSPYLRDLDKVQIINVSPKSQLNVFPKINYEQFFEQLKDIPTVDQNLKRKEIISFIQDKTNENK